MEGFQLWLNLPAKLKMTEPRYTGLQRDEIPALSADEGRVTIHLIAGEWNGQQGPFQPLTDVEMTTIEFRPGGRIAFEVAAERAVFLYVVRGALEVNGQAAAAFQLVELNHDGSTVELAADGDAFVLFGHATPYGEPVFSYGPFVMNTREEIVQAFADYEAGQFGAGL